ncbi:MAG: pyridoxal 5'-phosphate synthase glutaminase subunit PdxT [Candidatus Nitrosoabyssus spongiisocia]|nr:MAG: pyridoxal 5'-phosphate synthase glutaminase subunit PdxT [Nitrosopumilaceae archaeon AB1(1)]
MTSLNIGVIGIQGDVYENVIATKMALDNMKQQGDAYAVFDKEGVSNLDGIIIPGGESTTIGKLSERDGMLEEIKSKIESKTPTFGICAGLVLLGKQVYNHTVGDTKQTLFGNLDVDIERNAFGRQQNSFETEIEMNDIQIEKFNAVFIRAPVVSKLGSKTSIISKWNDKIIAVKQNHIIATAFHPELSHSVAMHEYFIKMIQES